MAGSCTDQKTLQARFIHSFNQKLHRAIQLHQTGLNCQGIAMARFKAPTLWINLDAKNTRSVVSEFQKLYEQLRPTAHNFQSQIMTSPTHSFKAKQHVHRWLSVLQISFSSLGLATKCKPAMAKPELMVYSHIKLFCTMSARWGIGVEVALAP